MPQASANIINLQRCVMTLNGVASATGAGNVRPSTMWRAAADAYIEKAAAEKHTRDSM